MAIGNCTQIGANGTQISAFYRFAFGDEPGAAKKMAAVYRRSYRTIQKWRAGKATPSFDDVAAAAKRHPKHRDLLIAWISGAPSTAELVARAASLRAEIERLNAALRIAGGCGDAVDRSGMAPRGSGVPDAG